MRHVIVRRSARSLARRVASAEQKTLLELCSACFPPLTQGDTTFQTASNRNILRLVLSARR